jgi:hypothetical protein
MPINDVSPIPVTWQPRDVPLVPAAVAARGAVARRLARRLLDFGDDALANLRGAAGGEFLIVTGSEESLPWVDGVTYLGRDARAPSLLVPTTLEPAVPIALFERALTAKFPGMAPLAVLADAAVAPMVSLRPIARESVAEWLRSRDEG